VTPFSPLLVPADLLDAVSGRAWLAAMLDAERALAQAGATAGIVPSDAAAAIDVACSAETFDWNALLVQGRRSGNPAEPLVRALVDRVGDEHAR
jgi:3-carboxy-cis,cis-muconate cycloisomerase